MIQKQIKKLTFVRSPTIKTSLRTREVQFYFEAHNNNCSEEDQNRTNV